MGKSERMQIRFSGDGHQIDSNTLINYLIHYNSVVSEVNNAYGKGNKKISVKVNALKEGSFIIDMSILEHSAWSFFSNDNVQYLAGVVTIVGGVYGLYKLLKGKPAKSESDKESISVTLKQIVQNNSVEVNSTIINVYNTKVVREAISKSFATVDEDEGVCGVELSGKDEASVVSFDRSEFQDMQYSDFETEDDVPECADEVVDARLTIISLNFERGNKWNFMYNGFKISINVKDDALMERIDQGERFGKGDLIQVKMVIHKVYNKSYRAYENKSYKIVEFIDHIVSPVQQTLF